MFSFCSVLLDNIIYYHHLYKEIPENIDCTNSWGQYKEEQHKDVDIRHHFFKDSDKQFNNSVQSAKFNFNHQYLPYKDFDFTSYNPFVKHFFNPSDKVQELINQLEYKYQIDYNNSICLYYRSTDKSQETPIGSKEDFLSKLSEILEINPLLKIVCLTDDLFFEKQVKTLYGEKVLIISEVRDTMEKWDKRDLKGRTYKHGLYFLATVFMLSKCHILICGSGNVSLWLALLIGHCNNIHQNLRLNWV